MSKPVQMPLFTDKAPEAKKSEAEWFQGRWPQESRFSCVRCGAAPGEPCHFLKREGVTMPHVDRRMALAMWRKNREEELAIQKSVDESELH